jgi:hypothetical protein
LGPTIYKKIIVYVIHFFYYILIYNIAISLIILSLIFGSHAIFS